MLSFDVRPIDSAEVTRNFVRVAAVDAGDTVVGHVARGNWVKGDEGRAGGRIMLPTEPVGAWQWVTVPLESFQIGTRSLNLTFPAGSDLGRYGFIYDVELGGGDAAAAYVPGRRPGLKPLLGVLPPASKRSRSIRSAPPAAESTSCASACASRRSCPSPATGRARRTG